MQTQPIYFIHEGRVVRGRVEKRHRGNVETIIAEHYVLPDGTDHPVVLNFKRKLGHEETAAEAGVLLALVKAPTNWNRAKSLNNLIKEGAL